MFSMSYACIKPADDAPDLSEDRVKARADERAAMLAEIAAMGMAINGALRQGLEAEARSSQCGAPWR